MHSSHDFGSTDTDFDCVSRYEYEDGFNMPQQSIRLHSPLSLSLISELKTTKSEPQHSYSYSSSSGSSSSSGPSTSTSTSGRHGRAGRNDRIFHRSGRDTELYGYGYDEEDEDEAEIYHEGYDSYDASPRYHSRTRSPGRAHAYPFSCHSTPSPSSFPSPFLSPLPTSLPFTYSLPHPEEIEDEAETSFPDDSNSTEGIEPDYTPSCNEVLRRQWNALAFRVRFSLFRARRRMRGVVGKGRKY